MDSNTESIKSLGLSGVDRLLTILPPAKKKELLHSLTSSRNHKPLQIIVLKSGDVPCFSFYAITQNN